MLAVLHLKWHSRLTRSQGTLAPSAPTKIFGSVAASSPGRAHDQTHDPVDPLDALFLRRLPSTRDKGSSRPDYRGDEGNLGGRGSLWPGAETALAGGGERPRPRKKP